MKRYKFLDNMIFPAMKRYSWSNFLAMKRYNRFRTYFFEAMQRYNIGNSRKCINYYSDSKNWLFSRPAPPPAPPPPPGPLDWAWLSSIHTVTNYKSCTCSLSFTQAPGRKHRSLSTYILVAFHNSHPPPFTMQSDFLTIVKKLSFVNISKHMPLYFACSYFGSLISNI